MHVRKLTPVLEVAGGCLGLMRWVGRAVWSVSRFYILFTLLQQKKIKFFKKIRMTNYC